MTDFPLTIPFKILESWQSKLIFITESRTVNLPRKTPVIAQFLQVDLSPPMALRYEGRFEYVPPIHHNTSQIYGPGERAVFSK